MNPPNDAPTVLPSKGTLSPRGSAVPAGARLVSLDAFRGATIAAMILVNNPGSWSHVYPPLLHAEWHGWTPTDLIFPYFLFILGVALPISYDKRAARGASRRDLAAHALRRSAIIFALGAFLAAFPDFDDWANFRIMGVLQRIGVVYLAASMLYLFGSLRILAAATGALLLGYWALMSWVPVPGYGPGDLSPDGNFAAWVDRAVLGQAHLWRGRAWDPEGLMSTLPAIATALLGIFTGRWMLAPRPVGTRLKGLVAASLAAVAIGWLWGWVFPINKNLWTSSYVLFTGGLAGLTLAACHWAIDVKGWRRWCRPFVWYGMNAIAVFVGSGIVTILLFRAQVPVGPGETTSAYAWIYETAFASWAGAVNGSLLFLPHTFCMIQRCRSSFQSPLRVSHGS